MKKYLAIAFSLAAGLVVSSWIPVGRSLDPNDSAPRRLVVADAEPLPKTPEGPESSGVVPADHVEPVAAGPTAVVPAVLTAPAAPDVPKGQWPQWGGTSRRNNTPEGKNIPIDWNVGRFDRKTGQWLKEESRNIKWTARLGSQSYGTPVIAGGRIFVGTNNGAGYLERFPAKTDLGCLLCFRQSDGAFLWQHSSEKLDRERDWPQQGLCCSPLAEGDRLWFVTNRGEVVCLDAAGFHDGENDGPFKKEASTDRREADVVWTYDFLKEQGVVQHNMCACSVTALGDVLFVSTSNGVDETHENIPAPNAPSFMAMDKTTGKVLWTDNSPGKNILHGQWSSPAAAVIDGVPQVIFCGGDGWTYAFRADAGKDGRGELLWKFDCNPKTSKWNANGQGTRSSIIATPVIHGRLVYVAVGQDPEHGDGEGHLWCIDATKRGDVSSELVVHGDDRKKVVPPRRIRAVDEEKGEVVIANPNSAAVWHYHKCDANGDGKFDFEEMMHRSIGTVAIKNDLLFVSDSSGLFHCLNARTGKVCWTYDMLAPVWGSPLIVDGHVFIGDEDGDLCVFEATSKKHEPVAEISMDDSVYSAPVVVDNVLYIANRTRLFAIRKPPAEDGP